MEEHLVICRLLHHRVVAARQRLVHECSAVLAFSYALILARASKMRGFDLVVPLQSLYELFLNILEIIIIEQL